MFDPHSPVQEITQIIEISKIPIKDALYKLFDNQRWCTAKAVADHFDTELKQHICEYLSVAREPVPTLAMGSAMEPTHVSAMDPAQELDPNNFGFSNSELEDIIKRAHSVREAVSIFNITDPGIISRMINLNCINGNLPRAKEIVDVFGSEILKSNPTLFFDVCAYGQLNVAKWIHSVTTPDHHILSTALWRNAYSSHCRADVMRWLVDVGATIPINIFLYITSLATAKWLLNHFESHLSDLQRCALRSDISHLHDLHSGTILDRAVLNRRYDLACWMIDEFNVRIINPSIINHIDEYIINALDSNKYEFVTRVFNQFSYKIDYSKVRHLMLTAVDVANGPLCQWFTDQYDLDPTEYGLDESFSPLGPKRAW